MIRYCRSTQVNMHLHCIVPLTNLFILHTELELVKIDKENDNKTSDKII